MQELIVVKAFDFTSAIDTILNKITTKDASDEQKCQYFNMLVQLDKLLVSIFNNTSTLLEETKKKINETTDSREEKIEKLKLSILYNKNECIKDLIFRILITIISNYRQTMDKYAENYRWSLEPSDNLYEEFRQIATDSFFSSSYRDFYGVQEQKFKALYGKSNTEQMHEWNESVKQYISDSANARAKERYAFNENKFSTGDDRQHAARIKTTHLEPTKTSESVVIDVCDNPPKNKHKRDEVFNSTDDETKQRKPQKISTKNKYNFVNGSFGTGYIVTSPLNNSHLNQSHLNNTHLNQSHLYHSPRVEGPKAEGLKMSDENTANGGFKAGRLDEGKSTKQGIEAQSIENHRSEEDSFETSIIEEHLDKKDQNIKHDRKVEDFSEDSSKENILGSDATCEGELSDGSSKTNTPKGQGTPDTPKGQGTPDTPKGKGTPDNEKGQGTPDNEKGQGTPDNEKDNTVESKNYYKECAAVAIAAIVICAAIFAFFKAQ
ncbi:hypothetical protein ENBRE01_1814 [Enteropsectra breve]|nr:hypothetical protein ENBRE01_1814 [Enteropsectra breve]